MSYIDSIINEVASKTPKHGFNVCLFDEYGEEKLIVLEHFDTRYEAEEYADDFEGETIYIYGNDNIGEAMVMDEGEDWSWQFENDNVKYWWNNADRKTVEEITGFNYKPYDQLSYGEKQQVDKLYGNESVRISVEATGLSRNWDKEEKRHIPMGYQLNDDDIDEETGFAKYPDEKYDYEDWQVGMEKVSGLDISVPKNHNTDKYIEMAEDDYNKGKHDDNTKYENANYGKEAKIKANEYAGQPTGVVPTYGIQKMLDTIVENSLNKNEKLEIVEKVQNDFDINTLLNLVAEKLASKVGKKLGVESKSNEDYNKETGYMDCPYCDAKFSPNDDWQMSNYDKHIRTHKSNEYDPDIPEDDDDHVFNYVKNKAKKILNKFKDDESLYMKHKCPQCHQEYNTNDEVINHMLADNHGLNFEDIEDSPHNESYSTEGGKGSGKVGHVPWMLGSEADDECPNCMIKTERHDGKCILCGN